MAGIHGFSDFSEAGILGALLSDTALVGQGAVTVALYTAAPEDDDSGAEAAGASYARQTLGAVTVVDGVAKNDVAVVFPVATEIWGTVTHIGIKNVADDLLLWGPLAVSVDVQIGIQVTFPIESIVVTVD